MAGTRPRDTWVGLAVVAIGLVYLLMIPFQVRLGDVMQIASSATELSIRPDAIPYFCGTVTVLLGLALIFMARARAGGAGAGLSCREALWALVATGVYFSYALAIRWLGFGVSSAVLVLAAARFLGERRWWVALTLSVVYSWGVLRLFRDVLVLPLPKGLLF